MPLLKKTFFLQTASLSNGKTLGRALRLLFLSMICGLGFVGCGNTEKLDDAELAWVQNGIACYYYNPTAEDLGQGKSPGGKFTYAKTSNGCIIDGSEWSNYEIWPEGEVEDGFYVIKNIRVWSLLKGYVNIPPDSKMCGIYSTIQEKLEHFCLETVRKDNASNYVHDIAITKNLSKSRHPIAFPSQKREEKISRIVIFGDSLSDTGNMRRKLGWAGFLSPPYWLGRFSNGPNWVDHLSKRLNLATLNFATGGAVAAKVNDAKMKNIKSYVELGGQLVISGSTGDQIDSYISSSLSKTSLLGSKRVQNPDETLFVLWAGANDYASKIGNAATLNQFIDREDQQGGSMATAERTVEVMGEQIERLKKVGATNFLIMNLPDMGATPTVFHNRDNYEKDESRGQKFFGTGLENLPAISNAFTLSTSEHNRLLSKKIEKQVNIAFLDVNNLLQNELGEISHNRGLQSGSLTSKYGVFNPGRRLDEEDLQSKKIGEACYKGGYMGGGDKNEELCKRSVYFDYVHPTSITHCWLSWFIQEKLAEKGFAASPGSTPIKDNPRGYKATCVDVEPRMMPQLQLQQ